MKTAPRPAKPRGLPLAIFVMMRRDIVDALSRAERGHPKPELVAKLAAELDTFDAKHPEVRDARGV